MNPGHDQPDSPIAEAILRTLLYADIFDFPMTTPEIHHFLIGTPTSPEAVRATLEGSAWLAARSEHIDGYYAVRGRAAIAEKRQARDRASATLWPLALRYGKLLAHLPFVRMVAVTGSLAMCNASHPRDDIDFLLVTAPGRVWLTRAIAVLLVRLARLRGVELCPNYVLAVTALEQSRRDLYMAHELAQMVPLANLELYRAMRCANSWADAYIPNAVGPFHRHADASPRGPGRWLQRFVERLLSGPLGDAIERWEQRRKQRKFEAEMRQKRAAAQLDAQRVKGHFHDHGARVMERYYAGLRAYNLSCQSVSSAGRDVYPSDFSTDHPVLGWRPVPGSR